MSKENRRGDYKRDSKSKDSDSDEDKPSKLEQTEESEIKEMKSQTASLLTDIYESVGTDKEKIASKDMNEIIEDIQNGIEDKMPDIPDYKDNPEDTPEMPFYSPAHAQKELADYIQTVLNSDLDEEVAIANVHRAADELNRLVDEHTIKDEVEHARNPEVEIPALAGFKKEWQKENLEDFENKLNKYFLGISERDGEVTQEDVKSLQEVEDFLVKSRKELNASEKRKKMNNANAADLALLTVRNLKLKTQELAEKNKNIKESEEMKDLLESFNLLKGLVSYDPETEANKRAGTAYTQKNEIEVFDLDSGLKS